MPGRRRRALGDWTLVGCTVAPGFEFSGFELAPTGLVARERSGHALRLLLIEAAAGVLNCVLVPPRPGTKPADRRQQGMSG